MAQPPFLAFGGQCKQQHGKVVSVPLAATFSSCLAHLYFKKFSSRQTQSLLEVKYFCFLIISFMHIILKAMCTAIVPGCRTLWGCGIEGLQLLPPLAALLLSRAINVGTFWKVSAPGFM